jgi:hypothetical protein
MLLVCNSTNTAWGPDGISRLYVKTDNVNFHNQKRSNSIVLAICFWFCFWIQEYKKSSLKTFRKTLSGNHQKRSLLVKTALRVRKLPFLLPENVLAYNICVLLSRPLILYSFLNQRL